MDVFDFGRFVGMKPNRLQQIFPVADANHYRVTHRSVLSDVLDQSQEAPDQYLDRKRGPCAPWLLAVSLRTGNAPEVRNRSGFCTDTRRVRNRPDTSAGTTARTGRRFVWVSSPLLLRPSKHPECFFRYRSTKSPV